MRIVIDTNVLVSFLIRPNDDFEEIFYYIETFWASLVSDDTISELVTVLSRDKFRKYIPLDKVVNYIEWYSDMSEHVIVTEHITACDDPKDDKFLSLAVSGKADCIIAGDHHLLNMGTFNTMIPIIRPSEFVRRFIKPLRAM